MQAMGDLLRNSLGRSLSGLSPADRLSAAWPVVAGHAIAEHSTVTGYNEHTVTITADDVGWYRQLQFMAGQLRSELAHVSRVPVTDILFAVSSAHTASTGQFEAGTQ